MHFVFLDDNGVLLLFQHFIHAKVLLYLFFVVVQADHRATLTQIYSTSSLLSGTVLYLNQRRGLSCTGITLTKSWIYNRFNVGGWCKMSPSQKGILCTLWQ